MDKGKLAQLLEGSQVRKYYSSADVNMQALLCVLSLNIL